MPAQPLSQVEGPNFTVQANAAVAVNLRVDIDANGKYGPAAIGNMGVGIAQTPAAADGDYFVVRHINAPGTQKGVASEAIDIGEAVYSAANGEISVTATDAVLLGRAKSAASGDGVAFEWIKT